MSLHSAIQTYQILTNDDDVCIPSLSSILLAVFKKNGDGLLTISELYVIAFRKYFDSLWETNGLQF